MGGPWGTLGISRYGFMRSGLIYCIQSRTDGIVNSTESNPTETFAGNILVYSLSSRRRHQLVLVTQALFCAASCAGYACYSIDIGSHNSRSLFLLIGRAGICSPLPWIRLDSFLPVGHYTYRSDSKKGRYYSLVI